ncbi:MAG: Smr/MutS family protein [Oceanospirillaceae bacterium]|nr:Smr/MutS family protein [Oceanospirillaceae bacterium]
MSRPSNLDSNDFSKAQDQSTESITDFGTAFGTVSPLKKTGRQTTPASKGPDPFSTATRRAAAIMQVKEKAALGEQGFEMLESQQSLTYSRVGLDSGSIRRLSNGHMRPTLTLDLHGYTIEAARESVWNAIRHAQAEGDRCLLIVHGKAGAGYKDEQGEIRGAGQALIKSHVNHWLQQIDAVLAFTSALPKDGGTGALYVLVKKKTKTA